MPTSFHRNRLTWLAYWMLAFYGYCINIFGPITPFLKSEFGLTYTLSSLHFTAFAIGILAVGAGGHLVIRRIGRLSALWLGAVGMSAGAVLLVAGKTPAVTITASLLMGLMGSLILAIVPATLSDIHGEQRAVAISEANVLASLVSAAAPLMVGWFAAMVVGWRLALALAALTPLILYLTLGKAGAPASAGAQESPAPHRGRLPGLYWVYWLALMLAVSVEFCMIFWSADFLETVLGLPKAAAAQAVSLFLGGMILGRLAGSRLVQRHSPTRVVIGSVLLASAGFLLFWLGGSAILGLSGLFLTGLGVASLYPLILSMTIGAARGNTVQASARATLASGSAILLLPLVLGRLADAAGIAAAYGLVALLLVLVFVIVQAAGRKIN
jgi:fucose permease